MQASKQRSNDIKHQLRQQGMTLKSFAEKQGFRYRDVSDGVRRGYFGKGREIAKKLGMPIEE